MAYELKVSHGSMQNLVKNELHLKSFERRTDDFLSEKIVKIETCQKQGHADAARNSTPRQDHIF